MRSSLLRVDPAGVSAPVSRRHLQVDGLLQSARRSAQWICLGLAPLVVTLAILVGSFHVGTGAWSVDFHGNFTAPAREILRGASPYHLAYLERVRDAVAAGHRPDEFARGVFVSYPAPTLLIGVPFSYLPAAVASWLWVGLMAGCAVLALRLVGVRDWRVYGAAFLAPAMIAALNYGTMNCALMLGLAAAWRWRDQAWRGGLALGVTIALKLLFVPLLAWLVFTRRFACAAIACASAALLWLAGWAVIGFDGFAAYPHLLSLLTSIERAQGYSSIAYARSLGLSMGVAAALPYLLGGCAIAALWLMIRAAARARTPTASCWRPSP